MDKGFNLLDESWLPVQLRDGNVCEMGLLDVFARSTDISALAETAPTSLIAQYRLLLAIFHRALTRAQGRWKDSDRQHWYQVGLPEDVVCDYLEHWRDRFWLFHPAHPFMQVAALEHENETQKNFPAHTICIEQFYGSKMFNHSVFDTRPRLAKKIICDMLGYFQFVPGGFFPGKKLKISEKAGPLANTAAVLPLGGSLSQTLCLALHPPTTKGHEDLPCWERDVPSIAQLRGAPTLSSGPNDRYTRLTRAVLLLPSIQDKVQWLRFAAGLALAEDERQPDPMASYKAKANGDGMLRLTFTEGRAFWRDLPALLPDASGLASKAAYVLDLAANVNIEIGSSQQPLLVAGLANEDAKLLRWRSERFVLPTALLSSPDCAYELRLQIQNAEEVFDHLKRISVNMIVDILPPEKDSRKRAKSIFDAGSATALFFAAAERVFGQVMNLLAEKETDAADAIWKKTLWDAAHAAWQAVFDDLGRSSYVLCAEAKRYEQLKKRLRKLLPAPIKIASSTSTKEIHS